MLNEKKVVEKLTEIVSLMKDFRMDFFCSFPEDANEERTSWSDLYNMASSDYYKMCGVKRELDKMIDDIDCCEYDEY